MGQYRHPGEVFLSQHHTIQSEADVYHYVEFLRREAGLEDDPPIDLTQIYRHFGIPTPIRVPLDEQQGILVDSRTGIILIKENDPIVRQRFTEGHELIELLFDAIAQSKHQHLLQQWGEQRKESLCDQGAADLLMPQSTFAPKLRELGLSLKTGRSLATLYQTSLLATLVRMIQQSHEDGALIVWRSALKPTQTRKLKESRPIPPKKLRIWWRTQTRYWSGGFIPKDKSINDTSLIANAYATGQLQTGDESIFLGSNTIHCHVEAMPLQVGDQACVLSLLHGLR
jgi:Zn-dependent peptidase ImmA (M78 family)